MTNNGDLFTTADRCERATLIAAPLERVWSLVAAPGFWASGDFPVRVVKVEPPRYVAYRWASAYPGNEPTDGNSTLVEFTLTEEGGETRLRVVESGFASLAGPVELRAKALRDSAVRSAAIDGNSGDAPA
jgi:uncharacterized protein YndB with AHSA1/START domain